MAKMAFLFAGVAAIVIFNACNSTAQPESVKSTNSALTKPVTVLQNISATEFEQKMKAPNTVVLDVRTPGEIAQGKINGALEIDVTNPAFMQKIKELDKSKTYLVYCRSGGRSTRACNAMANEGFTTLYNLQGGFGAWMNR